MDFGKRALWVCGHTALVVLGDIHTTSIGAPGFWHVWYNWLAGWRLCLSASLHRLRRGIFFTFSFTSIRCWQYPIFGGDFGGFWGVLVGCEDILGWVIAFLGSWVLDVGVGFECIYKQLESFVQRLDVEMSSVRDGIE